MNVIQQLMHGGAPGAVTVEVVLLTMAVALIVGQPISWCYVWTHHGVSYSRNFAQALVLVCLIVALVMCVIGTSLVAAFGLLGALAIVRFRTPVRDTLDTAFIFLALACGMAVGMGLFLVALVGAAVICLVAAYLYLTRFGARTAFDGTLRLLARPDLGENDAASRILERFCTRCALLSISPSVSPDPAVGDVYEYSYQIELRDPARGADLITAFRGVAGVAHVQLLIQEENDEP